MDITISGIDEICAFFDNEPKELCRKALGKALQAGVAPIKQRVAGKCPESPIPHAAEPEAQEDGTYSIQLYDHLKDAVRASVKVTDSGGVASVDFGGMSYIASFIEYGHEFVGHQPEHKDLHKSYEPHPFMRPALEESADEALEAFAQQIEEFYGD